MSEQSIWDAFGVSVDEVPENMFQIRERAEFPVNVEAEVKQWKKDDPNAPWFFVVSFTIMEGAYKGNGANRQFPLKPLTPADGPDWETQNMRTMSNLKRLLIQLGLNAEQIGAFRLTPQFARAISGIKGIADIGPQKGSDQYNSLFGFRRNESAAAPVAAGVTEGSYGAVSGPAIPAAVAPVPQPQGVGSLDNLANLFKPGA